MVEISTLNLKIPKFENRPANSLHGKGMARQAIYVEQDRNSQQLQRRKSLKEDTYAIFESRVERDRDF